MGVVLCLAGCSTPPRPTATPTPAAEVPAFVTAPAAEALPPLVMAERQAAHSGDIAALAQLWAADARIVDGRGTPEPDDDYHWSGRAAVLDRYRLAVFPSPPPPLNEADLQAASIQIDGDQATLQRNGDRWRFVYQDGRWWLLALSYP